MLKFSTALVHLYEAAENLSLGDFPVEVVRILEKHIAFDGGVLGIGARNALQSDELIIDNGYVFNRNESILDEYAPLSAQDPITQRYVAGLDAPIRVETQSFYKAHEEPALAQFTRDYDIAQLMLFGNAIAEDLSTKWLVLYRSTENCFSDEDATTMAAFWPHISRALMINRVNDLGRQADTRLDHAAALINVNGGIEYADPGFRQLLELEWGVSSSSRLSPSIMATITSEPEFCGKHIRLVNAKVHRYVISRGQRHVKITELSMRESVIATYFSQGYTYKEIGKFMGLSQHTVRCHIANIYSKLGVHNKSELTKMMLA
jgi:DNA-binding CsgD family transcriptional regulator